jgi:hypothetical protein
VELQKDIQPLVQKCTHCTKPMRGRSDKKFCSDGCRSSYHSTRIPENTRYIRKVNYVLRKNRNIMILLLKSKTETTVTRLLLLSLGFHFDYYTNIRKDENGEVQHCYDYCYMFLSENKIVIKRAKM